MNTKIEKLLIEYIKKDKFKIIEKIDLNKKEIKYNEKIKQYRKIIKITGNEELVRAFILIRLVNELGYKPEKIEIEKEYDIGRPKTNKPRIDIIVRDKDDNAFLYIELKTPENFEKGKDEIIEKQLFNLASQELGQGKNVRYLVLYTFEILENEIKDKALIIDYKKYNNFNKWKEVRESTNELPKNYGKSLRIPYAKGGYWIDKNGKKNKAKELETDFNPEQLNSLRKNLHNVLWGGGGTDDNEIFSSLVNIILAKIQDESEKEEGQKYDFQVFYYKDGEKAESNDELFERINNLYRRALKQRLNILDKNRLERSFVIDTNKFSLEKLRYAISELESYSFVDGKNSFDGKDILGDFFEGIIREGFKQTKGQFFTHINIVKFILWGLQLDKLAIKRINEDLEIPYLIDPSAGSGTFLIEYMKFITNNIKRRFKNKLKKKRDVEDKFDQWFLPDYKENKWAREYIYGVEINFNLGTATKVNMILHGDGSTNIFVKDGLLPFKFYDKETAPNFLKQYEIDSFYYDKEVNKQFDIVISNPPFSVALDQETKKSLKDEFIFGDKKNSENLFIERWYQLLRPNGRLGVVLPESVFDTTENKYIRLFLYKYFKIKAIISLPQLTFEPYTSTKTSLLFAQKKTPEEIKKWNELWNKYSNEWRFLKTRVENLIKVYILGEDRNNYPSIKDIEKEEELQIIKRLLKDYIEEEDHKLNVKELLIKYQSELGFSENELYKNIKNKINNYKKVFLEGKDKNRYSTIKNETEEKIRNNLIKFFYLIEDEKNLTNLTVREILENYNVKDVEITKSENSGLLHFDRDLTNIFGFVNTWWVFGEVAKELNYKIFMAEVENIGYKRTKRGEKPMPNELFRTGKVKYDTGEEKEDILLPDEDGIFETALDYMRKIGWD